MFRVLLLRGTPCFISAAHGCQWLRRSVIAEHGILRIKGFAHVAGKDMRLLIQGVGDRIQHYFDRDWDEGEERRTRLVVIGESGLEVVLDTVTHTLNE